MVSTCRYERKHGSKRTSAYRNVSSAARPSVISVQAAVIDEIAQVVVIRLPFPTDIVRLLLTLDACSANRPLHRKRIGECLRDVYPWSRLYDDHDKVEEQSQCEKQNQYNPQISEELLWRITFGRAEATPILTTSTVLRS
jgi:hypothetical protein